jgi:N-acetylglucosaminyl-diphospho-decaprenol L-rhamnosyltransferase
VNGSTPEAPAVTVTVVLYASEAVLRPALDAIAADVREGRAALVAVDNASPDGSADLVREVLPEATVIALQRNLGFAGGANRALGHLAGRYWLLLNPDLVLPPGGLQRLVEWMDAHPTLGVGSPALVGDEGVSQSPGRAAPSIARLLLELSRLHRLLPAMVRGRALRGPHWTGGDQLDADWVPGAAMLVRRTALDEVGPLSEDFFMYGEDLEWCNRMRDAGWGVGVCQAVVARHTQATSSRAVWGEEESIRRVALGFRLAIERQRGARYARAYVRLTALAAAAESRHPRRSAQERDAAARVARAWRAAARSDG